VTTLLEYLNINFDFRAFRRFNVDFNIAECQIVDKIAKLSSFLQKFLAKNGVFVKKLLVFAKSGP
jgi:hypothetical protein